jgi:plastocyanin
MRAVAVALVAVALLAGCGGGKSQPAGSIKVTLSEYSFSPNTISAPAGKVVFFLVNSGTVSHDLIIRDSSKTRVAASELISAGDSFVFSIDNLPAGSYTFYCDQPGHESSGMTGTLTVT